MWQEGGRRGDRRRMERGERGGNLKDERMHRETTEERERGEGEKEEEEREKE